MTLRLLSFSRDAYSPSLYHRFLSSRSPLRCPHSFPIYSLLIPIYPNLLFALIAISNLSPSDAVLEIAELPRSVDSQLHKAAHDRLQKARDKAKAKSNYDSKAIRQAMMRECKKATGLVPYPERGVVHFCREDLLSATDHECLHRCTSTSRPTPRRWLPPSVQDGQKNLRDKKAVRSVRTDGSLVHLSLPQKMTLSMMPRGRPLRFIY